MRFAAGLLSVVLPFSLIVSGSSQAREWDAIKSSGTIVAATEGGFQPFNYYDGPKLTGFEVELAEAIAKKLGLKLEWKVVPFDAQLAALKQDRFDFAIASHGYTEERAKSVDFAHPHYCTGGQIAAYKDGPLTVAALNGKTVGVQLATTYADAAKKVKGVKTVKTYKGDPEAFSALRAKKVDAWISDKFTVKATLEKNPDAGISGGEMVFVERVSMILRKNNKALEDKLNQALAEVMKDGTYKALSEKYFKEDISCRS
ncbi:MAG TPA: ABC transporter substrate-binding protein [Accumulibacter sp.]|uniref:ABC transporter substrate-binding protein n=1 Tax=Accumulibacter sp. TaxID=2053492 RepID=UPI0025E82394|nr:ABC transporter substrate-binding protein [Accumulibacter sp.]MCM8598420.1 ABC transporter substrate-binding protein [Accumulibacter sp.]MCM8662938.1 ABC transporter substrate-binding protein [Accumulibacter sp.]HNC50829.1 ABC transporter substrate-binding protein [Accumulibacter sp.]